MSKTRVAAKYTAAAGVTALYGVSMYVTARGLFDDMPKPEKKKVVGVAAGMLAATWLAIVL